MAKTQTFRGKITLKEFSPTLSNTDRILGYNVTTGEVTYRTSIDTSGFITSSLPSAQILVGNGSGVATAVAMTGVIAITNAGVTSIVDNSIVNADINSSAGIVYSKLNLTGTIVNADISNSAAVAYSKLNLATSIVNNDIAVAANIARTKIASGGNYKIVVNGVAGALDEATITASRAIVSDANGLPTAATTTAVQIGYLSTLTGAVQAQLDTQIAGHTTAALLQSPTASENGFAITWNDGSQEWELTDPVIQGIPTGGATGTVLMKDSGTDYDASWTSLTLSDVSDVTADVDDVNLLTGAYTAGVTPIELTYLLGTTSAIQSQINLKLDKALTENYLFIGNASNVAIPFAPGPDTYALTSVGGVPTWTAPSSGGTVTSVAGSGGTTGLSFTGSPVTTTGTLTLTGTLALANGGTGASLADPGADRIMFWDDSGSAVTWLTPSANLPITGTTIGFLPTAFTWDFNQFETNRYDYAADPKTSLLSPYAGYATSTGTSYTQIVVQSSDIPSSSMIFVKAKVSGVKSDGTEGYSGYVEASFRKTSGGALSIVGSSTSVINEDVSGAVTGALSVSGTSVQLSITMGGASGNFTQVAWIEVTLATA